MDRFDVIRRLIQLREEGVEKEDRIFLVDEEIKESDSYWDPDEIREMDVPDERYN